MNENTSPTIDVMNTPATSIYEEFGVTEAVISGDLTEHEESMLQQEVAVRDGDDLIETVEEEEEYEDVEDNSSTEESDDSGDNGSESGGSGDQDSAEESTEEDLPQGSDNLAETSRQVSDAIEAGDTLLAEAIEKGLDPEIGNRISEEYQAGGLTQETYDALAEVGYSKTFVDAYLSSQSMIAEQFNQSVFAYAGGEEAFAKLTSFMVANMPTAVDAFNDAVDRYDSNTMKFILDQAKEAHTKKFGKRPAVKPPVQARQAAPAAKPAVEPFADRDAMIKAMSDRRYSVDPKYRAEVEARVWASNI